MLPMPVSSEDSGGTVSTVSVLGFHTSRSRQEDKRTEPEAREQYCQQSTILKIKNKKQEMATQRHFSVGSTQLFQEEMKVAALSIATFKRVSGKGNIRGGKIKQRSGEVGLSNHSGHLSAASWRGQDCSSELSRASVRSTIQSVTEKPHSQHQTKAEALSWSYSPFWGWASH